MNYLLNTWYAAGFCEDLGEAPIGRVMLDEALVLFRTRSGKAVALHDRCPHRFAPLHKGTVVGEAIRCPYHGLQYGEDGQCVDNPIGEGKIPKAACVKSYPVAERDGIVWVWFGDAPADESTIRRWPQFNDPEHYAPVAGYIHVQGDYQLVSDNLLDLSHAEFLHPNLATPGFNRRTQFEMQQDGQTVIASNWRPGEPITNLWKMGFDDPPEVVDHRAIVKWQPPSTLELEIGVAPVGRPNNEGPGSIQAHLITPETADTCHYFWKFARDFKLEDTEFSERLRATIQSAFETEDAPMIEAQHRYMGGQSVEALKPVLLTSDAASMRARRVLAQLLKAQAEQ